MTFQPLIDTLVATTDPDLRLVLSQRIRVETLSAAIRSCTACGLHAHATAPVPGEFPMQLPLIMIGEAPGAVEDRAGAPFKGPAGQLVDKSLARFGVERWRVSTMNVVCCRPPSNQFDKAVTAGAVEACSGWFTAQLQLSEAWVVLAFGSHAIGQFTEESASKVRGKPFWRDGRLIVPTWHPAYCLRRPEVTPEMDAAVGLAIRLASGAQAAPAVPGDPSSWLASIGWQTPNEREVAKFRTWWKRRGWVPLHSRVLDADVVVVRDADVVVDDERYASRVRWTLAELVKLAAWRSKTVDDMRRLQMVKAELGGEFL